MSGVWVAVALVGVATVAFKAAGPVALGGRALPTRLGGAVELLAPAVLTALVVTQVVSDGEHLVVDERLAGVAAAALALAVRAPVLVVVITAADVTALLRAL